MSASADVMANGYDQHNVLRPRPRKPQHSQVSQVSRMSSHDGDGLLTTPMETGTASGMTR